MVYQFPRTHSRIVSFIARTDHKELFVKAGDEIFVDYFSVAEVGDLVVIDCDGETIVEVYDGNALVAGRVVEINRKF